MKVSAKTDYACKALLELALHWSNKKPMQMSVIASRWGIPVKFLTQILVSLKQLGYVQSIRGKMGGYLLAKPPKAIKLSDVVNHMDAVAPSERNRDDVMSSVFDELNTLVMTAMEQINFETIVNRQRAVDNTVTFEI